MDGMDFIIVLLVLIMILVIHIIYVIVDTNNVKKRITKTEEVMNEIYDKINEK